VRVDLSGADSVGDIQDRLTNAIHQYETDQGVTVLGPGGVGLAGEGFGFDLLPGASLQFTDIDIGKTAADLGLTAPGGITFTDTSNTGLGLSPTLSLDSPISSLAGVSGPLGSFKLSNLGRSATIDLSGAQTIEDLKNIIEGANLGVRVSINASGKGIDVLNEVAGSQAQAMSIEEVAGNNLTATRLGIRSLSGDTNLSDFNFGRGVVINDGVLNPTTGLADPSLDSDLRITLGDAAGTTIDIDLRPSDLTNVQSLLSAINSQAATQLAAAGLPSTAFTAGLSDAGNGIVFQQDSSFPNAPSVSALNGSPAAENLGLLNGRFDPASATLTGEDRAKVRVDNLFSNLIDLRESLLTNNSRGITFAGEGLDKLMSSLAEVRGLVGGYAQRVDAATTRVEDRAIVDESIRSGLRDLDFAAAATKLQLLQTQQTAGLQVAAQMNQYSLLDFLG
jgi:flagellin-like hook-associated protein FlgL